MPARRPRALNPQFTSVLDVQYYTIAARHPGPTANIAFLDRHSANWTPAEIFRPFNRIWGDEVWNGWRP